MKSLKTYSFSLILFSFIFNSYSQQNVFVDHSAWDQILVLNVSNDGMVDYEGVTQDAAVFYKYFRYLQTTTPQDNWSRKEKISYWLNVYNATAMKMVIDEYPIKSIRDLENPWKRKAFKTNNVRYSLDDIEHKILRKFGDPRIHFLLNCASVSSPRLWNAAYTSENIDDALDDRTREFINDPQRNLINASTVKVSQLFKWYEKDFESNMVDVIDFINEYASVKIELKKLSEDNFILYDWDLNTQNEATQITSNHH